jgi:hypothetical protein
MNKEKELKLNKKQIFGHILGKYVKQREMRQKTVCKE